jgi:drug/metabolite transporter (DMT)-like permease
MGYASEMLLGGLTLSVMSLLVHEPWPQIMSYRAVGSFIYLIVFGSLIAFNAYMFLLGRTRPAVALSYTYINPIIGLSLGMWLAEETLTIKEAVAAGVILIGLIIAITGRK